LPVLGSFFGAVLTGGTSRRMGRDKALLRISGRALAVVVADAMVAAGADRVVAMGGDRTALAAEGLTVVDDRYPGEGPLGGILTALDYFQDSTQPVVVLACDLPTADPRNVAAVVEALGDLDGPAVAVPVVDGRRQWMHASWTPATAPLLSAAFMDGERATWRAAEDSVDSGLQILEVDGPSPTGFCDVDQPSDLPPD
jgi:molybdopterin-guanine dinucleotide biosynthesis protein A